jgi:hypothetical protein
VDLKAHPPKLKIFYYILHACILEGTLYVDVITEFGTCAKPSQDAKLV